MERRQIPARAGMTQALECEMFGGSGATVLVRQNLIYGERARITCDFCSAQGWLSCGTPQDWPVPCHVCDGRGSLSLHAIAEILGEESGALYRLSEQRVRPRTAIRLLNKLLTFIENSGACPARGGNA